MGVCQIIGYIDMKTDVIVILGIMFFLLGMSYLFVRTAIKDWNRKVYVYPETGSEYMPLYRCRMKNPVSGEWFDAIIYKGVNDMKYYVMERREFLGKFIKLSDWKDGR